MVRLGSALILILANAGVLVAADQPDPMAPFASAEGALLAVGQQLAKVREYIEKNDIAAARDLAAVARRTALDQLADMPSLRMRLRAERAGQLVAANQLDEAVAVLREIEMALPEMEALVGSKRARTLLSRARMSITHGDQERSSELIAQLAEAIAIPSLERLAGEIGSSVGQLAELLAANRIAEAREQLQVAVAALTSFRAELFAMQARFHLNEASREGRPKSNDAAAAKLELAASAADKGLALEPGNKSLETLKREIERAKRRLAAEAERTRTTSR